MIYTIGTSDRGQDDFFAQIERREIGSLIDVRSSPSSRVPCFNQRRVSQETERRGLTYHWLGDLFGGRNEIATTMVDFQAGLETLVDMAQGAPIALFCAEGDPAICHRSYKIGAALLVRGVSDVTNILRSGEDETIGVTLARTRRSLLPPCLKDGLLAVSPASAVQLPLL